MKPIDFDLFGRTSGWIQRIAAPVRLLAALVASLAIAATVSPVVLLAALAGSLSLSFAARLPLLPLAKRLAGINAFMLLLLIVMPLSVPGEPALEIGPLAWSWAGLVRALTIAARGNAIILLTTTLVSTIAMPQLVQALVRLRVPRKLTVMLMLAVRYHHVLLQEYHRLVRAARVRGFSMQTNLHSYRTVGQLIGMLLVRSVERSSRILWAMKCRGYET